MPFEPFQTSDIQTIWRTFSDYLCEPYQNNRTAREGMEAWFQKLHERDQKTQKLELSFVDVRNEVTGLRFNAYRLNNQMYFSEDMAVLTLPQPGTRTERTDRDIGVWLHDFGKPDQVFEACIVESYADLSSKDPIYAWDGSVHRSLQLGGYQYFMSPYTNRVVETLSYIDNPLFGGSDNSFREANTLNHSVQKLTIALKNPAGVEFHRDTLEKSIFPWLSDQANFKPHWNRTLIHPKEKGTIYKIGRSENVTVDCPAEAVSCHLGCKNPEYSDLLTSWGAKHRAGGHPKGRSAIILETYDAPIPAPRGPWTVTVLERARPVAHYL